MASNTVGMIGLGIMGSAMAANLVQAGFAVVGHDVVAAKRSALARAGGKPAASGKAVGRRAPIVVTSLPSAAALVQVCAELAQASRRGQIVIETSTLPIEVKEAQRALLAAQGISLLDCPLSGTGIQARSKDLVVYVGGEAAEYRRCIPVFEGFARAHYRVGPFGAGSKMKFLANLLVAVHNVAAAEALVLGMKAGLDPARVREVLASGAGNSRMLEIRGPLMVRGDYSPAMMRVDIWQKDMKIIGDFARSLDCPTPLFAAAAPFYSAAMGMGHAAEDTASVCAVLEALAGHTRRPSRRGAARGGKATPPARKRGR
jgi:3-hydroxyisobutyrate dehydrogenase-like beta-hydroxyacid dehydrogenase